MIVVLVAALWSISTSAELLDEGAAVCYQVEHYVDALVGYTRTSCIPSKAEKPGVVSFIVISSQPIFAVEAAKKGWLAALVGAVGKILNDRPSLKVDELWVSDSGLMKKRSAYVVSAPFVKALQRKVFTGELSLEEGYASLTKRLTLRAIPASK
jgi:hypothetical protein